MAANFQRFTISQLFDHFDESDEELTGDERFEKNAISANDHGSREVEAYKARSGNMLLGNTRFHLRKVWNNVGTYSATVLRSSLMKISHLSREKNPRLGIAVVLINSGQAGFYSEFNDFTVVLSWFLF